jgi:calcineurin-like phosphoesterase family protein
VSQAFIIPYSERNHSHKEWYDDFIEKADNMNVYLISDTHLNHANIATYCDRPKDFTQLIMERWNETVGKDDTVIHLGDVILHKKSAIKGILDSLNGRKILIRGNHDRQWSNLKWMENGFAFSCDGMKFRQCWLTHEPSTSLADGCILNIHGHLHNVWHGFHSKDLPPEAVGKLKRPWQRLFAIEYTDYRPVEFDKFVDHPVKYQATGPRGLDETRQ